MGLLLLLSLLLQEIFVGELGRLAYEESAGHKHLEYSSVGELAIWVTHHLFS